MLYTITPWSMLKHILIAHLADSKNVHLTLFADSLGLKSYMERKQFIKKSWFINYCTNSTSM